MNNVSETESLDGKLATYPLCKSFAQRLYDTMDNIYATQEILDHKNVNTTQKYLDINYAKVRDAVESMVGMVESESDKIRTYANCVKKQGISPKALLFRLFNPLNPPYQGDFERKCVSPKNDEFVKFWHGQVRHATTLHEFANQGSREDQKGSQSVYER